MADAASSKAVHPAVGAHHDEKREQFRRLIVLRCLIACVLIGVGLLIVGGQESAPVFPLVVILGGTIVVTPLFWIAQGSGSSSKFLVAALTTMDIFLETVLVHYTGGAFSQFTLLYFLSIVCGSVFYQLRGTLALATLAAASYAGLIVLEASGAIAPVSTVRAEVERGGWVIWFHAGFNILTFYMVAFLSGQLSLKVERRGRLLQSAAEELRATRFDTDQILENLSSGLVTLSADGRIVQLNHAGRSILGIRGGGASGLFPREALGENCAELTNLLERSLTSREPLTRGEVVVRTPSGGTIPLGISTSILARPGADNESRGLVAIFQDLTETRRLEESLRRADRMSAIGELSAGVAHEIRNPLASICGAAQILEAELKVTGEEARLLRLVVREADRLNRFLGGFLDYARSRPRQVSLVPVANLLEDVKTLTESHPKFSKAVAIETDFAAGDYYVEADEEDIKRVFLNLAQNAVEAMTSGGSLSIQVSGPCHDDARGDLVRIVFRDTGPGVSEVDVAQVFKPFVTGKKGGTGLGLAIAQKIVEEHNGEIRCENEPGRGAAFIVMLPGVVVPESEEILAGKA
ncbi:MAG: two-component system sensor histidine kinase NtrB [bacterium]